MVKLAFRAPGRTLLGVGAVSLAAATPLLGFSYVSFVFAVLTAGYFYARTRDAERRLRDRELRLLEVETQLNHRWNQENTRRRSNQDDEVEVVVRSEEDAKRWKEERLQRIREKYASTRRTRSLHAEEETRRRRSGGDEKSEAGEEEVVVGGGLPEKEGMKERSDQGEVPSLQEEVPLRREEEEEKREQEALLAEGWEKMISPEQLMAAAAPEVEPMARSIS